MILELKAATALVPIEEEKVQEVVEDDVTNMSSDEHHKNPGYITEVDNSIEDCVPATLLTIGKVGAKWTYQAMYVFSFMSLL